MLRMMFFTCLSLAWVMTAQAKIVTKTVAYKHGDVVLEGYLAYDDAIMGKRPGVLIAHEWWGLNDYARMRARMLAEMGYVAFAANMYGKGVLADDPKKAGELAGPFYQQPQLMRDRITAGLDILRKDERVDPARMAAIGYCFGGTTVLELAYSGADIAGVVSFHGGLSAPKEGDAIKAKILVLHGSEDPFIAKEDIAAFETALIQKDADWQMISYSNAVHAFTNPDVDRFKLNGAAYNKVADERSWQHLKLFLAEIFGRK